MKGRPSPRLSFRFRLRLGGEVVASVLVATPGSVHSTLIELQLLIIPQPQLRLRLRLRVRVRVQVRVWVGVELDPHPDEKALQAAARRLCLHS